MWGNCPHGRRVVAEVDDYPAFMLRLTEMLGLLSGWMPARPSTKLDARSLTLREVVLGPKTGKIKTQANQQLSPQPKSTTPPKRPFLKIANWIFVGPPASAR